MVSIPLLSSLRSSSGASTSSDNHEDLTWKEKIVKGSVHGTNLSQTISDMTVSVQHQQEDSFFTTSSGTETVVTRYDLEKAVPNVKKRHFIELERYWVNKPFSFVIIFRSTKENEIKYYAIEPYMNAEEEKLVEFLKTKLQDTIKYSQAASNEGNSITERAARIETEAYNILLRYSLISEPPLKDDETDSSSLLRRATSAFFSSDEPNDDQSDHSVLDKFETQIEEAEESETTNPPDHVYLPPSELPPINQGQARPEHTVINSGPTLTKMQAIKSVYYLKRDSVMYSVIDPIKHDIQVEDISCDGYNSRVWAYHENYEQIITNIEQSESGLDNFVINLAQRAGQGISKRNPQVDITLPDGSRGQLTLGSEVSDHGTNYTIRQFKDVPFTPIDLINWKTFDPTQMAFLWLAIENHKSMVFAGGTASGKTTSLNAVSLFIPSNTKIVSIEDTREVELPQRNWVASVTRSSFTEDGSGEVNEFDLLEAALRQRPDYIIMGEIRGEEGRTLFQVMSTGHTTYTTFHADSVSEVIKRFTTDPINVSKTLFTALDLISIQSTARINGNKVRRNKSLSEVKSYNSETDEISVTDLFQWIADTDSFEQSNQSKILEEIKFDRGLTEQELNKNLEKREVVLAYLITNRLNSYTQVAATIQAFINDEEIILDLIYNNMLEESLANLQEMESVTIDIDEDKEALVPRPEPTKETLNWAERTLNKAEKDILRNRQVIEDSDAISRVLEQSQEDTPPQTTDETETTSDVEDNVVIENGPDPQNNVTGFVVSGEETTPSTTDGGEPRAAEAGTSESSDESTQENNNQESNQTTSDNSIDWE